MYLLIFDKNKQKQKGKSCFVEIDSILVYNCMMLRHSTKHHFIIIQGIFMGYQIKYSLSNKTIEQNTFLLGDVKHYIQTYHKSLVNVKNNMEIL